MGRIIRLQEAKRETRSGRYSAAKSYESGSQERETRSGRFSTREVYDGKGPQLSPSGRLVRENEPIVCSGGSDLGTEYALRLDKGRIARVRLTRETARRSRIDWVFVPTEHRGAGHAGRILRAVAKDADRAGVTLILEARACAGLSQAELEAFYGRFGFEPTGLSESFGPLLRRSPRRSGTRRAA